MVVVHFTTITGSSSTSRWRVTRVPISSPVSPPLVSSLCSQRVLAVSSRDLQGPITCCRNIAKLQSFIVHSSSNHVLNAIPVSSLFRRCITNVSSKSCQNTAKYFTTVLLPLHRSIIQTTKHIAKLVSEPPPISVEALSRPVVSISSIHRQRITASFFECHPLHIGALPSHCHSVLTTLSLLFAVSLVPLQYLVKAYPQLTPPVFSSTIKARHRFASMSPTHRPSIHSFPESCRKPCQSTAKALSGSHVSSSHSRRVVKSSPMNCPFYRCLVLALPPRPVRDDVPQSSSKRLQISLQTAPEAPRIPSSRSALVSLTLKAISSSSSIPSRLFILVSLLHSSHFKSSHR